MAENKRLTEKFVPVFVGFDQEHVLGKAVIEEKAEVRSETNHILESAETVITIRSMGVEARRLAEFLTAPEIVALSFVAIPPRPINHQEK